MKKIGNTTTGNVIVEMTSQEYEALARLQGASTPVPPGKPEEQAGAATMSHTEKVVYIAERLRKLSPKKRDAVVRSIEAMFQFNGGIDKQEVDKIVKALENKKFFSISSDGKVTYPKA
jgi:hypothetical protein